MVSPPLTLVIVDDRTMVVLDEILAAMAEALEAPVLTPEVRESLRSLSCRARALVLEERDSGLRGWKIIQDVVDEING